MKHHITSDVDFSFEAISEIVVNTQAELVIGNTAATLGEIPVTTLAMALDFENPKAEGEE